jgi:hypothetical protein
MNPRRLTTIERRSFTGDRWTQHNPSGLAWVLLKRGPLKFVFASCNV